MAMWKFRLYFIESFGNYFSKKLTDILNVCRSVVFMNAYQGVFCK